MELDRDAPKFLTTQSNMQSPHAGFENLDHGRCGRREKIVNEHYYEKEMTTNAVIHTKSFITDGTKSNVIGTPYNNSALQQIKHVARETAT